VNIKKIIELPPPRFLVEFDTVTKSLGLTSCDFGLDFLTFLLRFWPNDDISIYFGLTLDKPQIKGRSLRQSRQVRNGKRLPGFTTVSGASRASGHDMIEKLQESSRVLYLHDTCRFQGRKIKTLIASLPGIFLSFRITKEFNMFPSYNQPGIYLGT